MHRLTTIALLVLAALPGLAAAPQAAASPLVRIDIVDREHGRWLPTHDTGHDVWIAGTPGHRYGVRLTNTSGERVLVVLSIDGVNAVSGETAHPSQAGYVLAPWQGTEIDGWRKSWRDVAAFVFTALDDSYAARTGRPDNVGTIGIAVFRERRLPRAAHPSPPVARGADGHARGAAPAAAQAEARTGAVDAAPHAAAPDRQQLGTGHGGREWSPAGRTSFVRASRRPAQVTELRYDSPRALAARGIVPHQRHGHRRPQAFPGAFVPDPPPRRR